MWRLAVGVVVPLILSCGTFSDTTIDLVFDACAPLMLVVETDATAAERQSVALAADMWNRIAGTHLLLETDEDPARLPIRFEDAAAAHRGQYDDEQGVVYVNRALTDGALRTLVIAHELGHAFGLTHVEVDERLSLMNRGNEEVGITTGDVEALGALWGPCGP